MVNGRGISIGAKYGVQLTYLAVGVHRPLATGPIPTIGDGTGSPIRRRTAGDGSSTTMADGSMMTMRAGSGFPATSGAQPGFHGDAALDTSAGSRCRPRNSSSNIVVDPTTGFSAGRATSLRRTSLRSWCRCGNMMSFFRRRSSSTGPTSSATIGMPLIPVLRRRSLRLLSDGLCTLSVSVPLSLPEWSRRVSPELSRFGRRSCAQDGLVK